MNHFETLIKTKVITDLTKPAPAFEKELAKVGQAFVRLVEYVEIGSHEKGGKYGNANAVIPKARITFELVSPMHLVDSRGEKLRFPHLITNTVPIYSDPKSNYIKQFNTLNYQGIYQHYIQMLHTEVYGGQVTHNIVEDKTYVNLNNLGTPILENPLDGSLTNWKDKVEPAITPIKMFLWKLTNKELMLDQWNMLFIETPEDYSRNVNFIQRLLLSAKNFEGSMLQETLLENDIDYQAILEEGETK